MKIKTEDLINIAKQNLKSDINPINDIHRFILVLKLKEGFHKVHKQIIYNSYGIWSSNPVSEKDFIKEFNKFFTPIEPAKYGLNFKPLELLNKSDNLKNLVS